MARLVFETGGHSLYPKIQLRWHGSGDQYWVAVADASKNQFEYLNMGSVRTPHIGAHLLDGQTLKGYYNGTLKQNLSNTNYVPTAFNSNNTPRVGMSSQSSNYPMHGDITELLVFEGVLTLVERQIVETHLSAKYNVAVASSKLYAGSGASLGDYDADVIGVGRTNDSIHLESEAAGLRLTADAGIENGAYLFAGHKTASNSLVRIDPESPGSASRWSRVWYLDKTANLTATLTFDWSEGGLGAAFRPGLDYRLLYSDADPFTFSRLAGAGVASGDQVSFTLANDQVQDGYYTLGVPPDSGTLLLLR